MLMSPRPITSLDDISGQYAAIFCDVWGVVHNGVAAFQPAVAALRRARDRGIAVILITNAPRPSAPVEEQLAHLGAPRACYDRIVTSGDVTRELISEGPRRIYHLGPEKDLSLYDGLDVDLVEDFEAAAVCCTGLVDDDTETPEDYGDLLKRLRARNLPFVCANPDIVVEKGDRLLWCAGALARDYGALGGRTLIAGKPHRPIYDAAVAAAETTLGRTIDPRQVLAIGDGVLTDVKGAADFGLDVLYVSGGIHARDYGEDETPDPDRLDAFLGRHGYAPVATMPRLS